MTIDRGLLAILEAKAGKGEELAAFLQQARELAVAEEGTVTASISCCWRCGRTAIIAVRPWVKPRSIW